MATDANPMHCAVMFTITVWPTMDGFGALCNVSVVFCGVVTGGAVVVRAIVVVVAAVGVVDVVLVEGPAIP